MLILYKNDRNVRFVLYTKTSIAPIDFDDLISIKVLKVSDLQTVFQ